MKQEYTKSGGVACVIYLLIIVPAMLWKAYVMCILWGWFVVPKFGLPTFTIAEMMGLNCAVTMFTYVKRKEPNSEKSKLEETFENIAYVILTPAFSLLFGWIVKHYLP